MSAILPRGHERWERARVNAVKRPKSQAAQLYFNRIRAATHASDAFVMAGAGPFRLWDKVGAPDGWSCSIYCVALLATLNYGTYDVAEIAAIVGTNVTKGERPTRSAKCRTCDRPISPALKEPKRVVDADDEFAWLNSLSL